MIKSFGKANKRLLTHLLLLGLLFQVQTVFACQMVESHRGPAAYCCCEGMPQQGDTTAMSANDGGCCDLENTLTLTSSDNEGQPLVQARPAPDLPLASLAFVLASLTFLPEPARAPSGLVDTRGHPGAPGANTWLRTRRLRI